MKRLCFLSPDPTHTRHVVADLLDAGIPEKHIYVVASSDTLHRNELTGLPDQGPEGNDFLAAWERGLAFGGIAGLFAGILVVTFPPAGLALGGGAVLLIGLAGSGLGGLLAGIAGAAFHSSRLSQFEKDLEQGKILVLVDVAANDRHQIEELIHKRDPGVIIEGIEPPTSLIPP